jgi:hypothetical protein
MTRVRGIGPAETRDPEYMAGLKAAVSAAVGYGLTAVGRSEGRLPPIPMAMLSQARLAARNGVSFDVVLRRYLAGHTMVGDFLVAEADGQGVLGTASIKDLLRGQAAALDRVIVEISKEYSLEGMPATSNAERRLERIERLLAGERLDTSELAYPMDDWHLGLVADGLEAEEAARRLASSLDCRLLLTRPRSDKVWAWLGSRRRLDPQELVPAAALAESAAVAVGEPARGLGGWRLTHQQAREALQIAMRGSQRFVRYGDAALLISALKDDLLSASLHQLYLDPLGSERDGGTGARETLRAYLAAGRNTSATAAALGVTRRTVTNRLRSIEERLGRELTSSIADLEVAIRLDQLRS